MVSHRAISCVPCPAQTMGDHLKETGKGLVMDPERQKEPVEWVQRLLQVRVLASC